MAHCWSCCRTFVDWHAACQHMNALGHWACETCNLEFWNEDAAEEHMHYWNHRRPRIECEACDAAFHTHQDARRHMDAMNHWREHWCSSCKRGFQNENNLRQHLNSNTHRGSNITCPFCRRAFTTATGVTHHLETGSCANARTLNHDTILAEIRRRDPHHVITKKLLTYHSSTPTSTTATSASWNSYRGCYECYLCHKGFSSLPSLNQHVNSPVHKQRVYHCPGRACSREFVALAGLFNHLESESCGTLRFEAVQRKMGDLLSGKKLISFA